MIKEKFYTLLLLFEIVLLVYVYSFGKDGISVLQSIYAQQEVMIQKNKKIVAQSERLEEKIAQWHETDFFIEKVAREQLNMAHKDDIIYYTS